METRVVSLGIQGYETLIMVSPPFHLLCVTDARSELMMLQSSKAVVSCVVNV